MPLWLPASAGSHSLEAGIRFQVEPAFFVYARTLRRTPCVRPYERWLIAGGVVTGFASLLHVAIIIGGADWYRFFLRPALVLISTVYILRGALGVPVVLLVNDPYLRELRARPVFMIVSSAVCLGLGVCYAFGAAAVRRTDDSNQ